MSGGAANKVSRVGGLLSWWDGVELWLSGLGFVLQTIVVIPAALALAYVIAAVVDSALGGGIGLMRRARLGSGGPVPARAVARRSPSPGSDEDS